MIGVFDSGLGGLSVLDAIAKALPEAELTYLADTAHVPYGEKSETFIQQRVLSIGKFLKDQGCSEIVVACNTATAAAVTLLRETLPDIPIIGIEPGIKPAAEASQTRHIAVLTTTSTANSLRLARLIDRHASSVIVDVIPCPGWATRVEAFEHHEPAFIKEAQALLKHSLDRGADQIVLGCTHYSFLAPAIQSFVGAHIKLVDVADAVARQSVRFAHENSKTKGKLHLLATANPERLQKALSAFSLSRLESKLIDIAKLVEV